MLRLSLLASAVICLMAACKPCKPHLPNPDSTDFIVFGRFYGECAGEQCVEIFAVEEGKIYEDTKDHYPGTDRYYDGSFMEMSPGKYDLVKNLKEDFPQELLNETTHVIGQPDAGDWGGLYVEYNYNGVHGFWLLDEMKSHVPTAYHHFIDVLNEKVNALQ